MHKEMLILRDLQTHLQRLKSDLHDCVGFIQEPKKLQESVKTIYAGYLSQDAVVKKSSVDEDIQKAIVRQRDYQEKTVNGLKARLAKSSVEHEKVYFRMMKEKDTLFTEVNELRKELHSARAEVKDHVAQLADLKRGQIARRASKKGADPEGDN